TFNRRFAALLERSASGATRLDEEYAEASPRVGAARIALLRKLALEPRPGEGPVAYDGAHRQLEVLGDLGVGHAGAEPQRDHLCRGWIPGPEPGQRRLEREQVFERHSRRRRGVQEIVEGDRLHAAAALVALLVPSVVDEQTAHGLRREREAVRP